MTNSLGHRSFPCNDALIPDTFTNAKTVCEVFNVCRDNHSPFTTPLLYDKKTKHIVANESMLILKMINDEFNDDNLAKHPEVDLYPKEQLEEEELQKLNDTLV